MTKREYMDGPAFDTIDTDLGKVDVKAVGKNNIYVTSAGDSCSQWQYLTANRVEYSVSAHFERGNGGAWALTSRVYATRRGSFGTSDTTPAAYKKIEQALSNAVVTWAASDNGRADLREAAVATKNNDLRRIEEEIAALEKNLNDARNALDARAAED